MIKLLTEFLKSYLFLFKFSRQSKKILFSIFFLSICIGGFDFLFLYFVSSDKNIAFFKEQSSEFLIIIPVILFIARNILYLLCSYLQGLWVSGIRAVLAKRVMDEYIQSGLAYLYQARNGEINRNLTAETLMASASMAAIITLIVEVIILGCWAMLIRYEDIPLLFGLLGILLLLTYGFFFVKLFSNVRQNRSKFEAERSELVLEMIENKELFWSLGIEVSSSYLRKFEASSHKTAYNDNLRSWLSGAQRPFFEVLGAVGFLGYLFLGGASGLELGPDPTVFAVLGGFFFVRVLPTILKITTSIQGLFISCDAVFRIKNLVDDLRAKNRDNELYDQRHMTDKLSGHSVFEKCLAIESNNVCFDDEREGVEVARTSRGSLISTYHFKSNILHLGGRSGVGKSSLLKSLLGNCVVNGLSSSLLITDSDRQSIGYASQDARLVGGSIRENIVLGRPNFDESWLQDVIYGLQINQFTDGLEHGIETAMKRTHSLSGGQVQRIALARAIFAKPSILLLDEALGGVEVALQRQILEFVFNLDWQPVTIFTSHHVDILSPGLNYQNVRLINLEE